LAGGTFGNLLQVTTFGESHGPGVGVVITGFPAGFALDVGGLTRACERRRPGQSRFVTGRREPDQVIVQSGLHQGLTTGAPIALWISNTDARPQDYERQKDQFRPGHAEYSYHHKYGHYDPNGGGRASARETAVRVAAGEAARQFLQSEVNVEIRACTTRIGRIQATKLDWSAVRKNPFYFAQTNLLDELEAELTSIRRCGDAVGGVVMCEAIGVPAGLGEPMYRRLDADLAAAMVGIQAAKGVEIGEGFAAAGRLSSQHRDEITPDGFLSNNAGGILGGISTGQNISLKVAFKPTSSIRLPAQSVDINNRPCQVVTTGRHDPCVAIRAVPVVEAMMALTLMDHYLMQRARHPKMLQQAEIRRSQTNHQETA
jgi:chorismate synthase